RHAALLAKAHSPTTDSTANLGPPSSSGRARPQACVGPGERVAKLTANATHPRELERAARALAALTRTLRELNGLLSQCQAPAADADDDEPPEDIDEFRRVLAQRIHAFIADRTAQRDDDPGPQGP